MLLLADRGFYSWGLWHAAAGTGAHLLWRVSGSLHLPVVRPCPTGPSSPASTTPTRSGSASTASGRGQAPRGRRRPPETGPLPGAATVRVIEFTVTVTAR